MDWLRNLLSVDAPPGAALHSAELGYRGLFPWWAAGLLALVFGAVVFLLYARESVRLTAFRRWLMAGVRFAIVALVLLLLLRPVLVCEFRGEKPRGVVLLVDNSLSMAQRDQRLSDYDRLRVAHAEGRVGPEVFASDPPSLADLPRDTTENPARIHLVRTVLNAEHLQLVERLRNVGPFRMFLFGQRLRSLPDVQGVQTVAAAELQANETRTALADAVQEILLQQEGDPPAAIVILTDGRDNASKLTLEDLATECARRGVPLHIYGVGSSEVGNLQVKEVVVPDTIFFDDAVSVLVRWSCHGFKEGSAEITLTLGGKTVARKEVEVRPGDDLRELVTFTPQKGTEREEKLDLVATVTFRGNEVFLEDNALTRRDVRVIDRKVKVLYVEGSPRWEYKFLMTALTRDRRVDPSFVLVQGDPRALAAGPPFLPVFPATRDALFAFDLLILGDVPAHYLNPDRLGWIRDFVREGGGLVLIAGRQHAPASYHNTPLAEVLPIEFLPLKFKMDPEARPEPLTPLLTRAGERSDLLALADTPQENTRIWKELPGFCWHYPVTKLRPGAVALLAHPRQRLGDQPMPLLATHHYGKGTVLFSGVEETWRWRYNARDRYFARYWGQVVYQLGLPHLVGNPKRVQLTLERAENFLGRPGYVYARVFDAEYRPLTVEKIAGTLERVDAKPGEERSSAVALHAVPEQPGEYRALLPHNAVGRFVLRVDSPEAAALEYRVSLPPQHELEVAGMAEDALRQLATQSGGRFYHEEDLHRLPDQIEPKQAPYVHRQEVLLWSAPLMFLLIVGLFTAEWVLRKYSNLS